MRPKCDISTTSDNFKPFVISLILLKLILAPGEIFFLAFFVAIFPSKFLGTRKLGEVVFQRYIQAYST